MKISRDRLLSVSVIINIVLILFFSAFIYRKGGTTYIKSKFIQTPKPDWRQLTLNQSYRKDRITLFDELHPAKDKIVFFGDSMTDGCEWDELFDDSNVINRGIDGDTCYGALDRLDQIISIQPKKIFIMLGTNDIKEGRPIADIVADYKEILGRIQMETNATIYVQSVLPSNVSHRTTAKISALNARISDITKGLGIQYINLYPLYLYKDGLKPEFTDDGTHLNGLGYLEWGSVIKGFVCE